MGDTNNAKTLIVEPDDRMIEAAISRPAAA
jgi:hypothetical protein